MATAERIALEKSGFDDKLLIKETQDVTQFVPIKEIVRAEKAQEELKKI